MQYKNLDTVELKLNDIGFRFTTESKEVLEVIAGYLNLYSPMIIQTSSYPTLWTFYTSTNNFFRKGEFIEKVKKYVTNVLGKILVIRDGKTTNIYFPPIRRDTDFSGTNLITWKIFNLSNKYF